MQPIGAFVLHVEQETETQPLRVSICLSGVTSDARGVLRISLDCMRLDDLEGCINALQDELDLLRAQARRVFTTGAGHA